MSYAKKDKMDVQIAMICLCFINTGPIFATETWTKCTEFSKQ